MILVKAMVTAMKSVAYVMCLLVILVYVFAIAATQLTADTDLGYTYFDNVLLSMYTLAVYGTFCDELSSIFDDIINSKNWSVLALFLIFLMLSALTVMNMLIGVLCEVVSEVADRERQEIMAEMLAARLKSIVEELDDDHDETISYTEFMAIMEKDEAVQGLRDVGIDPVSLMDLTEMFFIKDGVEQQLPFKIFMENLLELRGSNQATLKDILNFTTKSTKKVSDLTKSIEDIRTKTNEMQQGAKRMEGQMKALMKHVDLSAHKSDSNLCD